MYHGGGIHKILNLMGTQWERKFIKSIAQDKLSNELKEREAYILNEKVKKCMNLDKNKVVEKDRRDRQFQDKGKPEDIRPAGYMGKGENPPGPLTEKCVCNIWGKDEDHVLSMNGEKAYIDYVACKMFVDKSPRERDKLLYKKHLCSKCLKPGIKWNAEHTYKRNIQAIKHM